MASEDTIRATDDHRYWRGLLAFAVVGDVVNFSLSVFGTEGLDMTQKNVDNINNIVDVNVYIKQYSKVRTKRRGLEEH